MRSCTILKQLPTQHNILQLIQSIMSVFQMKLKERREKKKKKLLEEKNGRDLLKGSSFQTNNLRKGLSVFKCKSQKRDSLAHCLRKYTIYRTKGTGEGTERRTSSQPHLLLLKPARGICFLIIKCRAIALEKFFLLESPAIMDCS